MINTFINYIIVYNSINYFDIGKFMLWKLMPRDLKPYAIR